MKQKFQFIFLTFMMLSSLTISAQGLVDGFFNKKGSATISLSYSYSDYSDFYVGKEKVSPVPAHEKVSQDIYNLYLNYALTDKIQLIANLPYIQAEGEGVADPINGTTEQKDLHDLSIAAKWSPYRSNFSGGYVDYIVATSVAIPLGYEPNGILSIGSGATAIDGKVGIHFQTNFGFFTTLFAGYSFRGDADDEFGVVDGDFDVPDATVFSGKIGYAASKIYLDAWADINSSVDGVDIGGPGFVGNFPETRVSYARIGADVYVPITSLIGINAGFGTVVDGRNIGDFTFFTSGVVINLSGLK